MHGRDVDDILAVIGDEGQVWSRAVTAAPCHGRLRPAETPDTYETLRAATP